MLQAERYPDIERGYFVAENGYTASLAWSLGPRSNVTHHKKGQHVAYENVVETFTSTLANAVPAEVNRRNAMGAARRAREEAQVKANREHRTALDELGKAYATASASIDNDKRDLDKAISEAFTAATTVASEDYANAVAGTSKSK